MTLTVTVKISEELFDWCNEPNQLKSAVAKAAGTLNFQDEIDFNFTTTPGEHYDACLVAVSARSFVTLNRGWWWFDRWVTVQDDIDDKVNQVVAKLTESKTPVTKLVFMDMDNVDTNFFIQNVVDKIRSKFLITSDWILLNDCTADPLPFLTDLVLRAAAAKSQH